MNLDNKKEYDKEYQRLRCLPINDLSTLLEELYNKRVMNHQIEFVEQHRLASRVYQERTRKGTSLIFHMQNFILK